MMFYQMGNTKTNDEVKDIPDRRFKEMHVNILNPDFSALHCFNIFSEHFECLPSVVGDIALISNQCLFFAYPRITGN